ASLHSGLYARTRGKHLTEHAGPCVNRTALQVLYRLPGHGRSRPMNVWLRAAVLASLVIAPATVFAQASVTGVVKDATGAVLPGVTVEAASDVLIEKTRSAITDGS